MASSIWDILNYCIVPVADWTPRSVPVAESDTKIAAGASIAGISSQAKITTVKLENLKFMNKNEFFKKNKYAPNRVAILNNAMKS
jgi:hypothetical protein